jgi:hypothetical protein
MGIANTTEPTSIEAVTSLVSVATNGQPGLYALALLVGLAFLWRTAGYRLALLWGVGVPALAFIINLFAPVYTQRYMTYLSVGLAVAAGAGLAALGGINRQVAKHAKKLSNVALAGFAAICLWALPSELPERIPYRDLLRNLSAAAHPGDVVFFDHADTNDNFAQWQYEHYLSAELRENPVSTLDAAREARRVWYITTHWFDDTVRETFADLERTHPVQQVLEPSRCDRQWCYLIQLMEAPPWDEPVTFGADMAFWGANVDSMNREAIQTRLWWRVEQPLERDYSISLQLLSSSGALVAQSDGPINHYGAEVVETSQLEPGRIYIDHRIMTLPPELPAGAYTLALVVYQPSDGERLALADGSPSLALDTFTIP